MMPSRHHRTLDSLTGCLWRFLTYALCLYDFVGDVLTSIAFCASGVEAVQYIGYIAACVLTLSSFVNFVMVFAHVREHRDLYDKHLKRVRCWGFHFLVLFAAFTNSELMRLEIDCLRPKLDERGAAQASLAEKAIQPMALVSQTLEDGPQLTLQIAGSAILASHGETIPHQAMASIGTGLLMLLFKSFKNLLSGILRVKAPETFLQAVAANEGRAFKWPGAETLVFALLFQILTLLASAAFAGMLWMEDVHKEYRRWPQLMGMLWVLSYLAGCGLAADCIAWNKKLLWHMLLHDNSMVAVVVLSTLHPGILVQAFTIDSRPALHYSPYREYQLFFLATMRAVCLVAMSVWALWKDPFPISNLYCALYAALCIVSFFWLLWEFMGTLLYYGNRTESNLEASSFTSYMSLQPAPKMLYEVAAIEAAWKDMAQTLRRDGGSRHDFNELITTTLARLRPSDNLSGMECGHKALFKCCNGEMTYLCRGVAFILSSCTTVAAVGLLCSSDFLHFAGPDTQKHHLMQFSVLMVGCCACYTICYACCKGCR